MTSSLPEARPPYLLIVAVPVSATRLRGFLREGPGSPGWLLTQPPVIRRSGFGTSTGDIARLVRGEFWEAQHGDRKLLRLYQDGSLFFRMRADEEFLAWALQHRAYLGEPTLNPVAVVESHLAFVYLLQALALWFKEAPAALRITLRFSNAWIHDRPIAIARHSKSNDGWGSSPEIHPLHSPNAESTVDLPLSKVTDLPEAAAYQLLTALYDLFDAGPELIPFVTNSQDGPLLDVTALKAL